MVVRLLMIVAAAVVLLSSGFSCYMDGKMCHGTNDMASAGKDMIGGKGGKA